jgi:apolipoprotein N-acyltransferase
VKVLDGPRRARGDAYNRGVRRVGYLVGALLVLAGIFWSGRESSHGLGALWEHWWCPLPVVAIVVGLATMWLFARRLRQPV